jgi:hypothetical protein
MATGSLQYPVVDTGSGMNKYYLSWTPLKILYAEVE